MDNEKANALIIELENTEVVTFEKKDFTAYNRLMANIEKGFTKASEAYVTIACNLWQIYHNEYFRIDKFKSIADFAENKYEIKKSTTHNYIKVVEKFGEIVDEKPTGLKEQYKAFKCSQLINMLTFTPEQLETVKPEWSVREIIEFGKKDLLPAKEFDEDIDEDSVEDENEIETSAAEYMTVPEINAGKMLLAEFHDLLEIETLKDVLMGAYNDLLNDKNFKNKNVRFVIELAYD